MKFLLFLYRNLSFNLGVLLTCIYNLKNKLLKQFCIITLLVLFLNFSFIHYSLAQEKVRTSKLYKHCGICCNTINISKIRMINWFYKGLNNDYFNLVKEFCDKNNKSYLENRFHAFPIKYFIHPYSLSWTNDIKEAIKDFNFYFPMTEVNDYENADLVISFMDAPTYEKSGFYPSLGLTTSKFKNNKYRSLIIFPDIQYPPGLRKKVIIHELGHAFGIQEHSNNESDIMFSKFDPQIQNGLTERDLNTLFRIYEY